MQNYEKQTGSEIFQKISSYYHNQVSMVFYYLCASYLLFLVYQMKRLLPLLTLVALLAAVSANAQEKKPDWRKLHYLSEEEMNTPVKAINFTETDPPTGELRFVAEFEPMQGVMISYTGNYPGPLGFPASLVAQLADNCHVYCIVTSDQQGSAQNTFQNAGVNMSNVTFVNAPTDSYWVRDYGPWYIFEDLQPAIVDNIYNRPRPNDDSVSGVFASFWNIPMYGMKLIHTGGNMMQDGRGHGVSDDLVLRENAEELGFDETVVRNKMRDYLGIDPYHITIDPQGDYIAHVDCWGKYLAPDKILIARLPENNPQYSKYEEVANYFATTNCCWGYPYKVYRVEEPGDNTLAPYTNSLILNKTVYVPLGSNNSYNQQAIAIYQEAMPGYEIVGVNSGNPGWHNTDALHCRTRGVMDFEMLFVDHRNVIHGEQEWQDSIAVTSKFIAYSKQALKQDSLLVYYSIDGGAYQTTRMTATANPNEYVGYIKGYQGNSEINYYVFGADQSGHRYTQPVFADLDPHHFTMKAHTPSGELVITPDTLWFTQMGQEKEFIIKNETTQSVAINNIQLESQYFLQLSGEVPTFPVNLAAGESLKVTVAFQNAPGKGDYVSSEILIATSLGQKKAIAMLKKSAMDFGLVIVGTPALQFDEPGEQQTAIQNRNLGSGTPIELTSITVENPDVLNVTPEHPLPYTLAGGATFRLTMSPNTDAKAYVHTQVTIHSDDNDLIYEVSINEELLSINETEVDTRIYPNPTSGSFKVKGRNIATLSVYNLVGQKVCEKHGDTDLVIDASNWDKGVYLVDLYYTDGHRQTRKLVVQ